MNSPIRPAFDVGRVLLTRGIDALNIPKYDLLWLLRQHVCCQWQMEAEDIHANMEAIKQGYRVFGSLVFDRITIWVITEADRASTTILLPDEY
ncbi:plasmid related protein [Herpetosiphon gulosus]|uniref:Plasmid related protein n=1 Tax=Herpetosiphon gulosus TaxID=1973496 RepID=A0ABP9X6J2_9CHLR